MDQQQINEIHTNLFLDPEQVFIDAEENKIYYINEDNDFVVFTSPVPFSEMETQELAELIHRLPKPQD